MDTLLTELDVPFKFNLRSTPLPADMRPAWRVAFVLLVLLHSRGHKSTLQKLHVINSAMRTAHTRQVFADYVAGRVGKDQVIPRVEPSLNRAVNYAKGEKLVENEKGKNLRLTPKGLEAAKEIDESKECLELEKVFLRQVKQFSSEGRIEDLFHWEVTL